MTAETTLAAAARLAAAAPDEVACLNFASAHKPGGGWLSGAQAQEESLARASALVAALASVPEYHAYHRRHRDPLYTDRVVHSPGVPVFRDDEGRFVDPYRVAFLTAAAPHAGHLREPVDLPAVLRRRAGRVLAVAHRHSHRRLVLGAWGCGVFRNDPRQVAAAFAALLAPGGSFAGRFPQVVFAIPDAANRGPFAAALRAIPLAVDPLDAHLHDQAAVLDHRPAVVVPVRMLAADRPVDVDQLLDGGVVTARRRPADSRAAALRDGVPPEVRRGDHRLARGSRRRLATLARSAVEESRTSERAGSKV